MKDDWIEEVHGFWFEQVGAEKWFHATAELDAEIRNRFSTLYQCLKAEPPDATNPRQAVAGVIVLDQFPRNMFRGTAAAFGTDQLALRLAQAAVARQFDHSLYVSERQFLYMPYMHSENDLIQEKSLQLFAALGPDIVVFAKQHRDIVARFGRFPHRNAMLGRPSSPEEIEFLKTAPAFG
jgi:uncharacterized protein (DUF924 family)